MPALSEALEAQLPLLTVMALLSKRQMITWDGVTSPPLRQRLALTFVYGLKITTKKICYLMPLTVRLTIGTKH